MKVQLVRHATMVVEIKGLKFLIDPMLSEAETVDPSPNTVPVLKNPLVGLPDNISLDDLRAVDAVIFTQTHRDHWDDAAVQLLPDSLPIFCQPQDIEKILDAGFTNVTALDDTLIWNGIRVTRTDGRHGKGGMAEKMGPVSGFIIEATNEPSLYITGDSVWCEEVKQAYYIKHPNVIVAFAGGAQFTSGGPITMTAEDIYKLCTIASNSRVIAVHMESWNHCLLSRNELRAYLSERGIGDQVLIPKDGDVIEFHN